MQRLNYAIAATTTVESFIESDTADLLFSLPKPAALSDSSIV